MSVIRRGEVHFMKGTYTVGSEQRGDRPVVVVSNNAQNDSSSVIQVVYMTLADKKDIPTHIKLGPKAPEKVRGSLVLAENVYSISKERLVTPFSYIGRVSEEDMQAIDRALLVGLDLERYTTPQPTNQEVKVEVNECTEALAVSESEVSEEVMALKVAVDFYKEQYEALLDRVLKKAKV